MTAEKCRQRARVMTALYSGHVLMITNVFQFGKTPFVCSLLVGGLGAAGSQNLNPLPLSIETFRRIPAPGQIEGAAPPRPDGWPRETCVKNVKLNSQLFRG